MLGGDFGHQRVELGKQVEVARLLRTFAEPDELDRNRRFTIMARHGRTIVPFAAKESGYIAAVLAKQGCRPVFRVALKKKLQSTIASDENVGPDLARSRQNTIATRNQRTFPQSVEAG